MRLLYIKDGDFFDRDSNYFIRLVPTAEGIKITVSATLVGHGVGFMSLSDWEKVTGGPIQIDPADFWKEVIRALRLNQSEPDYGDMDDLSEEVAGHAPDRP